MTLHHNPTPRSAMLTGVNRNRARMPILTKIGADAPKKGVMS